MDRKSIKYLISTIAAFLIFLAFTLIVAFADVSEINELMYTLQPANLNCLAGGRLSVREQDELRAKIIRKKLFPAE